MLPAAAVPGWIIVLTVVCTVVMLGVIGSLLVQRCCPCAVLLHPIAELIKHSKAALRVCIPLICRLLEQYHCPCSVLLHPIAPLIKRSKVALCLCIPLINCLLGLLGYQGRGMLLLLHYPAARLRLTDT